MDCHQRCPRGVAMSAVGATAENICSLRVFRLLVESRCGAVALGRTYLLPPLSSGGASMVPPWLRFHIPLIEPDRQICRVAQPLLAFAPTEPTVRRYRSGLFRKDLRRFDSGRLIHTLEVWLQGLPALCLALRLPRRDPFLPLPFLHHLVSFGDFVDNMERQEGITSGQAKGQTQRWQPLQ